MQVFVEEGSIVRQIWGKADTILFIFAGAAAEFVLNKAVDWLYYTGRLPADPLGRLFSTVSYARTIVFSDIDKAHKAIDKINAIHKGVETERGEKIPDWAYRDVLFMLIDYSIRSFELLERKLTITEKEEVFEVFHRMGTRMRLKELPENYKEWLVAREQHLNQNLEKSMFTVDLYKQYRKHLGFTRFSILTQVQLLITPQKIKNLLKPGRYFWLSPILCLYKISRRLKLDWFFKSLILPEKYQEEIKALDVN